MSFFRTMCQHLVLDGVTDRKWHCLQPVKWDISSPSLGKPCFIWRVKVVFFNHFGGGKCSGADLQCAMGLPTRSCRSTWKSQTVDNPQQRPDMTRPFVIFKFCSILTHTNPGFISVVLNRSFLFPAPHNGILNGLIEKPGYFVFGGRHVSRFVLELHEIPMSSWYLDFRIFFKYIDHILTILAIY